MLQWGVFALVGLIVSFTLKALNYVSEIAVVGGAAATLVAISGSQYIIPMLSSSSSDQEAEEESDEEDESSDEEVEEVAKASKKKKKTRNFAAAKKAKRAAKRVIREEREREEAAQQAKDDEQKKMLEDAKAAEEGSTSKKKKKKKKKRKVVVETVESDPEEVKQAEPELEWQTQKGYSHKPKKAVDVSEDGPKQSEITFKIDSEHYSKIIGRKGETIRTLRENSGAEIQMPKKGALHDYIIITGSAEACQLAKKSIEDIAKLGYSQLTHPNTTSDTIQVPKAMFPRIMGSKGSTIRLLQDTTQTSIELPERGSGDETVTIIGAVAMVLKAKAALQDLMDKGYSNVTHPDWTTLEIPFDQENVSALVGKGGSTIQALQKRYDVQIRTPNASHPGFVVIIGPAENLNNAAQEIRLLSVVEDVPMEAAWRGAEAGFDLRALNSWD